MNFRTPFAPVMMLLAIMTFGYSSNSYAVGTLPFAGVRADTIFGGTIDSDTQWSAGVYMVTGSINVSASATLTISSGAILKFNQSTNLDVRGGFVADDVVFTSWRDDAHGGDANDDGPSSGEPGDWQGIHFYDAAGGGAFTDCLVRYAGQHSHTPTGGNWGITARSCPGPIDLTNVTVEHTGSGDWAVYLATPGTISGCVFRDNLGSGLWIVSTDNTTISGNSATGNAGFGYGAHADFLSDFAQSSNTQSGNGGGDFVLASPTTVTDTTTWSGSYDYYFEADVDVIAGATLTISPGAILKFMPSTHLDVRGGFVADDVVFTSWRDDVQGGDTNCDGPSSGEPGDWQGIHFYDAAGGGSFIDCLVRYAGQHISTPTGGRWGITARNCPGPIDLTNVTVEHTGSGDWAVYMDTPGTISGCTVRDNLGNGLWIAPSDDTTISGNSATGNAGFGYGIHANLLGNFGQNSNTQSENGFGDFVLASPTVVADTATWSGSYDYYFEAGADVTAGATLTISPGAILKFMPSTHLDVRGGFVADDVVFTSWRDDVQGGDTNCDGPSSGESGDWQGIHFYDAAGGGAFIDCLVRYAGQHISTPTGGRWGITARNCPGPVDLTNVTVEHTGSGDWAVYLDTPGTISGCTVRDNLGNGLWIAPSDDTTISGNSATGNAGFGYGIHANLLGNFGQNSNTQSENGFGDFVLASPTVVADTATWSGSYDYYFEAGADVTAGATLTISPGAILKFMPSTHLDVRGGFVADDVVFTSWRDDSQGGDTNSDGPSSGEPGDWQGIHFFDAAGGGAFTDCLVRYAGQHISTPTGGNWGITARSCPGPIDLTNVTVEYTGSGDWAVYLATPGTISGCVARDNLGNGINIDSSDTHLTTTDIYNDSGIGLQYTPADTLIAANCYWGHATGPQHTDNPGGLGTVVTGNVDFIPWSELPNTLVLDVVVQGIVSDLVTEQPITGAQVTLLPLFSGSSTITNEAGFWSLDAPDGSGYSLTVVAEGYDDYLAADLSFESGQVYQLDVQMTQSVSIDDGVPLPRAVSLEQNCPNPFNPRTEIRFSLPASDHISLKIYDIQGRLVKVLVDGVMPAGIHGEVWLGTDEQGRQVTSGIYMYLLETSGGVWSKSMVVLK